MRPKATGQENFRLTLILMVPISVLAGFLDIGPGFILVGFETKHTAGINTLAVTPPSFSAVPPHLKWRSGT